MKNTKTKFNILHNSVVIKIAILFVVVLLTIIGIGVFDKGTSIEVKANPEVFNDPKDGVNDTFNFSGYTDGSPLDINTPDELRMFSNWYNQYANSDNLNTVYFSINLALTTGDNYWNLYTPAQGLNDYTFTSIGTSSNPFYGRLKITGTSINKIYSPLPIFNYMDQRTKVVDGSGNNQQIEFLVSEKENETKASSVPLLANYVVNPSGSAVAMEADVKLSYFDSSWSEYVNSTVKNFAGVIGEIGTGSDTTLVSLSITNNGISGLNKTNVENNSGNAGLFCNTINDNSVLTASINGSSTNTTYSVTANSSTYYAGGIVGQMYPDSKLVISGSGLNSVSQTVTGKCAGGIVGYAKDAYIDSEATDTDSSMTITSIFKANSTTLTGASGNGYLFGYYENTITSTRTIKLSSFTELAVTSKSGNGGGLIGYLAHKPTSAGKTFAINGNAGVSQGASITQNLTISLTGSNSGGVIGNYETNNLTNTLDITNVYTKVSGGADGTTGGVIGKIDDASSAAYVTLSKIRVDRSDSALGGGLVGSAGGTNNKGAFINVSDYIKINGRPSAGLVRTINYGVLRIEGITDLSELAAGCFIVKQRDSAIVYSLGTGSQAGTSAGEWRLIRHAHDGDDIGSWGEVVRLNSLTANAVIDETNLASNHTVTLKSTSTSGISSLQDFVLLALNMEHNTTNKSAALILEDTTNTATALLAATISLSSSSSIDLAGTGIMGLTRDNGSQTFTGTLNGNGSTISLAIGEAYGYKSNNSTLATNTNDNSNNGSGKIYTHLYSGLFGQTNGATINDLTVSGSCWKKIITTGDSFGGLSAVNNTKGDTFSNVTSTVTCNIFKDNTGETYSEIKAQVGGFIGRVSNSVTGTIDFTECIGSPIINDNASTSNRKATGDNYIGYTYAISNQSFGSYIGLIENSEESIAINFGDSSNACTIGGTYTVTSNSYHNIFGGLIGYIEGNDNHSIYRTINVINVEIGNLQISSKIKTDVDYDKYRGASGGLIGYAWNDTDVNITKLHIGGTASSPAASFPQISLSSGSYLSGLVYQATGHWTIDELEFGKATFTATSGSASLGLIANSGINTAEVNTASVNEFDKTTALYLEILDQTKFKINGSSSNVSISGASVFDEIVAYTVKTGTTISDNGQAIVSINTNGSGAAVTMTGSSCNTYQNQSYYGKNTVTVNANARYYYNLDTIRAKGSPSNSEKLLLWSLAEYANGSYVKGYFDGTTSGTSVSSISGSLDMEGLSYYPVDYNSNLTVGTISKLKFYNNEIETGEAVAATNTDGVTRSTTSTSSMSQHYMMHCGLFRNISADSDAMTVSLGAITVEGNVGIISTGSGFIACGTLGGGTASTTLNTTSIVLNGAYVNGASSSSFAPLLIANIESNTVTNINNVSSTNYSLSSGWYAATSLLGKAGNTSGTSTNMKIAFSNIVLDARKQNITDADNSRLNTVYGTTRSIFKTATLLEHYYFNSGLDTNSEGTYNFTYEDDWGTESSLVKHKVTYGQEIHYSDEYSSDQGKYYGSDFYISPASGSAASAYDFVAATFLPYVGNFANADANYHELKVNHSVVSLIEGCGTYNDPYVVNGSMLATVASILNGNTPNEATLIRLPDVGLATGKTASNVTSGVGDLNRLWCTGDSYHQDYYWDSTNNYFKNDTNPKTYILEMVQAYLAGAYYLIEGDIAVSTGLGGLSAYTAFRGVIVGKEFTDSNSVTRYPNVTINGASPFITTSNGSVIKNLNFIVDSSVDITIAQTNAVTQTFDYASSCPNYGVVIGKIMGGDNVIDNVGVTFNGKFTSDTNDYIVPVGGYVGVVVNGGLFFRNMGSVSNKTGLTNSAFNSGNHIGDSYTAYLYHNPIIGRVINGYAVTESNSYQPLAANQTMKNGTKNYAITDINPSLDKLDVGTTTVNIPNDQAWFIMSCIINSGSGSGTTGTYQMSNNNISYSKTNYKTTHIGTYNDVGDNTKTKDNVCDSLLFKTTSVAYKEMDNNQAVTPYLIEMYTTQDGEGTANFYKHYAKSIATGAKALVLGTNGVAATWTLPDSYRGIGGLNYIDSKSRNSGFNLTISSMTCNNTTIILNMKYQTYQYDGTTNSNLTALDNYPVGDASKTDPTKGFGFGLFNSILISSNVTISNLTLKGIVFIETYKVDGTVQYLYNNTGAENAEVVSLGKGRLHVGMLSGIKSDTTNKLTLTNVTLTDVDVHGNRCAGGLIGYAAKVSLNNCGGTNVKVYGRHDVGGLLGIATTGSEVIGDATNKTTLTLDTVIQKGYGFTFFDKSSKKRLAGVGGIVGRSTDAFTIKNMILGVATGKTGVVKQDNNVGTGDMSNSDVSSYVGGIYGGNATGAVNIENCIINGVSVEGGSGRTGGVVGGIYSSSGKLTIKDVILNGVSGSKISGTRHSPIGGIIGCPMNNVDIDGVEISNYTFEKTVAYTGSDNGQYYIGGLVGCVVGTKTVTIKNAFIHDCVFNVTDSKLKGCCGLIGSNSTTNGYNIVMKNITKTSKYDYDVTNSGTTKIVGFSRQNTPINTIGSVGSNGYIIFSDYSGVGFGDTNNTGNTDNAIVAGTVVSDMVDLKMPYANVNPTYSMSDEENHETILTGDGVASSKNTSVIKSIWDDLTAGTDTKRYTNVSSIKTSFNSYYSAALSTFNGEWGADTVDNDFMVLVVSDTNRANTTSMINQYIQLLTNQTKYNSFGANVTYVYKVDIYKMQLEEDGYFSKSTSNVHLHTESSQFYMSSNNPEDVDSYETKPTFTMIDISFYDPTTSSNPKVAYHLYIPVYVKKLLKFSFSIYNANGTPYYESAYGTNILMDNLGTSGSILFEYEYQRTKKEWQEAIQLGENLLVSYDKILTMTKQGTSTQHFDNDTLIALVDRNQNGKVYYARFSDVYSSGKLSLSDGSASLFSTSLQSGGTIFEPVTICDLLNITATQNNSSGLFFRTTATDATVKVGEYYYRLKQTGDSGNFYNLTIVNKKGDDTVLADSADLYLKESYYMSFYTIASNNSSLINYYSITSTDRLTGGSSPAKAQTVGTTNILFGNLFAQTNVKYQANYNDDNPDIISETNNTVKVKLESEVKLTDNAQSEISGLISGSSIYHSFLVYMTKQEGSTVKAIMGNPVARALYEIEPTRQGSSLNTLSGGSTTLDVGCDYANVGHNYIEATSNQNIASYLSDGGAKITMYVHITYNEQAQRMSQFASRVSNSEQEQNKYTSVSAESKIGFNPDTVEFSKTKATASMVAPEMKYYIIGSNRPTLEYNAFADNNLDAYGQLGINANYLPDDSGKVDIRTEAVYDISSISDDVASYNYVKVTFELSQKTQNYYDAYGGSLPIRTYMKDVVIVNGDTRITPKVYANGSYSADPAANATIYTFIVPRSAVEKFENLMVIQINFSVFTGTDVSEGESQSFEGKGLMYSNYKVTISCEMLENNTDQDGYSTSNASNYIIYTNTKVITYFISDSNQ